MAVSSATRREQLDVLERQRRTLIADLVKVDFEISQLRSRTISPPPDASSNVAVDNDFGD